MAEGWGGDLWKEQNGLLGEKKNPPKACKADFGEGQSVLSGEKENPPKAREADFGRWRSGLPLGKGKPLKACEEDFHGDRSVLPGEKKIPPIAREADFGRWRSVLPEEKERGDLGKVSFWFGKRSALHRLAQHAASAIAPHCVSHLTLLLLVPRRHRHLRQAPLSSPARTPGFIGRGCKEEAPSCSFPVRKVQEGALLYPVTLHSSASTSQRKGAGWSGHSV